MTANSSEKSSSSKSPLDKPKKPYKKFPLGPANCGYWQKRILGKIYYFGPWGKRVNGELVQLPDGGAWKEALAKFNAQKVDLYAGRTPRSRTDEDIPLKALCNRFLTVKQELMESKEIGRRMFAEYKSTCDLLTTHLGKERILDDITSDDLERLRAKMSKMWGPTRFSNELTRVRSVLRFGKKK
jgi:hypothetical protein